MDKKFMRLPELARALRLPAAWLRREAIAGRLPSLEVGRRRMFEMQAVVRELVKRQGRGGAL